MKKDLDPLRFLKSSSSSRSRQKSPSKINNSYLQQQSKLTQPYKIYHIQKYFSKQIEHYLNTIQLQAQKKQPQLQHKIIKSYNDTFAPNTNPIQIINNQQIKKLSKKYNYQRKDNQITQQFNNYDNTLNQDNQIDTVNQQLQKCQICGRSFNKVSHQKHIKVCQKVFIKKRKQFKSQQQRKSRSKQKR